MCSIVLHTHIIGHSDDLSTIFIKDLKPHQTFPFSLMLRVKWSKDIHKEQQCPDQILLRSMGNFCVLLDFSIYLEVWIKQDHATVGEKAFLFTDSTNETTGPRSANKCCHHIFEVNFPVQMTLQQLPWLLVASSAHIAFISLVPLLLRPWDALLTN